MANKEYQYAILRAEVIGRYSFTRFTRLLEYTTLEEAAKYMRENLLVKVEEKRFEDCSLVQWIVS